MIYLFAKIWQKCKDRKNHAVVAPLNVVLHPCLNNVQFNPIIVKSKTFLIRSPRALGDLKKAKKLGFSIFLFKRFSTLVPLAKEDSSFVSMGSYRFLWVPIG